MLTMTWLNYDSRREGQADSHTHNPCNKDIGRPNNETNDLTLCRNAQRDKDEDEKNGKNINNNDNDECEQ